MESKQPINADFSITRPQVLALAKILPSSTEGFSTYRETLVASVAYPLIDSVVHAGAACAVPIRAIRLSLDKLFVGIDHRMPEAALREMGLHVIRALSYFLAAVLGGPLWLFSRANPRAVVELHENLGLNKLYHVRSSYFHRIKKVIVDSFAWTTDKTNQRRIMMGLALLGTAAVCYDEIKRSDKIPILPPDIPDPIPAPESSSAIPLIAAGTGVVATGMFALFLHYCKKMMPTNRITIKPAANGKELLGFLRNVYAQFHH